jgi:DNA-directed RNA polymerase subunit M/transcription elongation factor TFIIS
MNNVDPTICADNSTTADRSNEPTSEAAQEVNMDISTSTDVSNDSTSDGTNSAVAKIEDQEAPAISEEEKKKREDEEYIFRFFTCKVCFVQWDWGLHWQIIIGDCRHSICLLCLLDLFLRRMPCPFCRAEIAPSRIFFLQPVFFWPRDCPEERARYNRQRLQALQGVRIARAVADEPDSNET